jgi:hypothetical protein
MTHVEEEGGIEPFRLLFSLAYPYSASLRPQPLNGLAIDKRIGVKGGDVNIPHALGEDSLHTRWRPTKMTARLKGDVKGPASGSVPCHLKGVDFSVGTAGIGVKAIAHKPSFLKDKSPHKGVRRGCILTVLGYLQGKAHGVVNPLTHHRIKLNHKSTLSSHPLHLFTCGG